MLANFRRSLLLYIATFCIAGLIFGAVALFVAPRVSSLLNSLGSERVMTPEEEEEAESAQQSTISTASSGLSILLVGTDEQSVTAGAPVSADTIILLTYSETKQAFVYIPLPSRIEVTVDDETVFLGEAYGKKGIDDLMEKVSGLTGLAVNYYAVVSIDQMKSLVNSIGGITFNVPVKMEYSDESQGIDIDLNSGTQNLDGSKAVDMLRFKNYKRNKFKERTALNLSFLQTAVHLCVSTWSKSNAEDIYNKITPYVKTNFGKADLEKYVDDIWSYEEKDEISFEYPGEYATNDDGYTIFIPDRNAAFDQLAQYKN